MIQIGCANICVYRVDILSSPDIDSLEKRLCLFHMLQTLPEPAFFGTSLAVIGLLVAGFCLFFGTRRR
jgi:hypothetical protein